MAKTKSEVEETIAEETQAVETEESTTEDEVLSVDEKINQTGTDAPTDPEPESADSDGGSAASVHETPEKPVTMDELLAAVRYLAGQVSSNAELAELRQAFPRIFK